jgi:hypothetical protein
MTDKGGPYRTTEHHDGDLVPTVAQCRRGYARGAESREQSKRREHAAWERYVKDEKEARLRYLQEESAARARFESAGREMIGWRHLALGFHEEDFSAARQWSTGAEMTWKRCIQLEDEHWLEHSVESTLKAFRNTLAEDDAAGGERYWPEELEELWRCFRNTRKKVVDPTRDPSLEDNAFLDDSPSPRKKK